MPWQPTKIIEVLDHAVDTATHPVIVKTDQGHGYFKAIENPAGASALAREFIGTSLADWLDLPTFRYCLFDFDGKLDIVLSDGTRVNQGVGFMTKEEPGDNWDKTTDMLDDLVNKDDITRLVILDTWLRNIDRCFQHNGKFHTNSNNVFIAMTPKNEYILKAMDFTHAFLGNLDQTMDKSSNINDEEIYGCYPAFSQFLNKEIAVKTCEKLKKIQDKDIRPLFVAIPTIWNIDHGTKESWMRFILGRANFVANTFLWLSRLDTSYLRF